MALKLDSRIIEKFRQKKKSDIQKDLVLLVDDEPENLIVLKDLLESEYEVHTASSGKKALATIEKCRDFKIIISDQRMPEMTGVNFLTKSYEKVPDAIRFILSGYTDVNEIIASINEGKIYKFMVKPFSHEEMLQNLKQAIEVFDLRDENRLILEKLKSANADLEQKVKDRTQNLTDEVARNRNLVRIICHDLMNCMAVIKGAKNLAQEKGVSDKFWQRLEFGIDSSTNILNNVREMEALKSGKKTLKMTNVKLSSIVEHIYIIFHDRLEEKKLTLKRDISTDLEILAEDVSLEHHVFSNIISNAIKFSPEGQNINIRASEFDQDFVKVEIQDFGIGIPQEIIKVLFEPDANTTRPGTKGEKGTGFGMPIVKTFMESYGGYVELESWNNVDFPDKHGTTFRLFFKKA